MAAPLLRYRSGRTPRQLLEDRDEIRAETGAEMDLNYVVTAGHVVKANDYARGTAARRGGSPRRTAARPARSPSP